MLRLREGIGMSNSAYERVKLARDSKRPTGLDYINCIFNRFIELHGDRRYADDPAVIGGIARLNDTPSRKGIPQKSARTEISVCRSRKATAKPCV